MKRIEGIVILKAGGSYPVVTGTLLRLATREYKLSSCALQRTGWEFENYFEA
jgi:hypothetical protein